MVTIKQIADKAGKTEATVSLALNDKPGVGEKTRKHIKELALGMGYTPNIIARELSTQVSRVVGLVVPNLENPFFANFATCVNNYLLSNRYKMMLSLSNQSLKNEGSAISDLVSRRVDGIIILPVTEEMGNVDYAEMLINSNIPFVFATSYYPSWENTYKVLSDLATGNRIAYEYLLKIGHRKIMYLGTNRLSPTNALRIRGAFEACEKSGYHPDEIIDVRSVDYPDFSKAYNFTKKLLLKDRLPYTAVTTLNDIMALGVMKALIEAGYSVPGDVSLVGFDNLIFSEIATVPLTTVEQDINKLAVRAAEAVIGEKWKNVGSEKIEPRLILRSSSSAVKK